MSRQFRTNLAHGQEGFLEKGMLHWEPRMAGFWTSMRQKGVEQASVMGCQGSHGGESGPAA